MTHYLQMTGKSIICTNDCRLQLLAPVPRPVTSQATQDVPAPSAPLSPHQYVTADADSLLDASSISCSLGIATRAAETPSPVTDAAIEDLSEVALSPGPGAHRCRLPPRDYINTNELSFWPSNAKGDLSFDNMDTLPRFGMLPRTMLLWHFAST
jgi:hypothetical protein